MEENKEIKEIHADIFKMFGYYRWTCQYIVDLARIGINLVKSHEGSYYPQLDDNQIFMPAHSLQMPEEVVEENFQIYTIRNGFRDLLENFNTFLSNMNYACVVYKKTYDYREDIDINPIDLQKKYKSFDSKGLMKKLLFLEKQYDLIIPYKEEIKSLNIARNCLVHRQGYITDIEIYENDKFIVYWIKNVFYDIESGEEINVKKKKEYSGEKMNKLQLKQKIVNCKKEFGLQSPILFTSQELFDIGFTFYEIARCVFIEVAKFGKKCGLVEIDKIINPYDQVITPKFRVFKHV